MKFGIDIGHNCPPDSGAVGIKAENNLNTEVGTRVIAKLRALGHEVINCTPSKATTVNDSLRQRVRRANTEKVGLYVSIHFNAFNKKAFGTEVFAISAIGRAYANCVLEEICKLGFTNRGVKDGSHLFVVKNTVAPAILIECCFCDSERDMDLYDAEKMADAIVAGLVEELPK
ncbi:hypothetical protein RIVM261_013100 [Rivularia sp. IAM M-261]|nr:hypothetical protein RIVM261_013100 [Rivularia sp. IAM M-261]